MSYIIFLFAELSNPVRKTYITISVSIFSICSPNLSHLVLATTHNSPIFIVLSKNPNPRILLTGRSLPSRVDLFMI